MAPTVAHLHKLVAKNVNVFKAAWNNTARLIQNQLPPSLRPSQAELQPILARNSPRQPLHPVAFLKQSKGRWYTTHSSVNAAVRRFTTSASRSSGLKYDRSSFPKSRIGSAVNALSGRAPFASTLRPNLTGGTLNRTAGGYALGSGRAGSARYFSHTPAAPSQVIHNVSQAVRSFLISGQKAQFDGVDPRSGVKRYKLITALQKQVNQKMSKLPKATPGSFVDFSINPTVTALTPLSAVAGFSKFAPQKQTLNTEGLLDILSVDFSRALKELAAVLNDLKRLSGLGDLPITYHSSTLRVHFPGCDAETVERICDELGVQRGIIREDEDFDAFVGTEIALLFPFAPSRTPSEGSFMAKSVAGRLDQIDWRHMMSSEHLKTPKEYWTHSDIGPDFENLGNNNPWLSSPSGYESLHTSDIESSANFHENFPEINDLHTPLEYQGIEGIYRFMEQCESPRN
ncbi:hypothetical protein K432DRAFT_331159 [Lepidopterella palustris CBS 459.81]|uniref:Casein kinase II beta 2 subunit n=1 Tax=Lepidopterella palustris CBS 459.81 TaxID=1314670 RepID=A0A8E2E833_9PEZI|nr:hypothetical protein K432DRAFT_331159 [Lepidopterella palustris CBS 459.81]